MALTALTEGALVEYFSSRFGAWIPATVTGVDAESGAVTLDVRGDEALPLGRQRQRLRPRTRPEAAALAWTYSVLREGRIWEEAEALFQPHVSPEGGPTAQAVRAEDMKSLAADLDAKLGVSGSVVRLLALVAPKGARNALPFERFCHAFWEELLRVQRQHGLAVARRRDVQRRLEDPRSHYAFGSEEQPLGVGTYGKVFRATCRKFRTERAVKMVSKLGLGLSLEELDSEVHFLRELDHPHVVKLYDYFEHGDHLYIVMDFCSGGELEGRLKAARGQRRPLALDVPHVMKQVLMAMAHAHARGVLHLDLKPANIMLMPCRRTCAPAVLGIGGGHGPAGGLTLAQEEEQPHVMLIDLGVAKLFQPGNFRNHHATGTPFTMAPEAWSGVFTPQADVFSMGVVLFELLTLRQPFRLTEDVAAARRFWAAELAAESPGLPLAELEAAPPDAADLCRRMLALDRLARPSAFHCLQSALFAQQGAAAPLPSHVARRLSEAHQRSLLHRSVALRVARAWPANRLPSIRRSFEDLDLKGTGRLDRAKLCAALCQYVEPAAARRAADAADLTRDGWVDWTEFVAASIDLGGDALEADLRHVFEQADGDGDGLLGQRDLELLLETDCGGDVAADLFRELAGHGEAAQVDWPAFRLHFRAAYGHAAD